jgi:NAD-dependent dihydropyrimidine dehydrogenase PreA subunit
MTLLKEFATVFGVWDEALPYLDAMVTEKEMALVVALAGREMTPEQLASRLALGEHETRLALGAAYSKHLVDRTVVDDVTLYSAGSFPEFLNHFAKHGAWDELPKLARQRIDRRFLDHFVDQHRDNVARMKRGLEPEGGVPNDAVLLVSDVDEMIDAAEQIIVETCDCRRLGQNCDRPVEVCIWFDDLAQRALDRGQGRILEKDEAKELVRWADRKGLMHTGDDRWRERGLTAVCNCCSCDCYPFRAAQELGAKGAWPRSRFIAVYDEGSCNLCGSCVRRCHFDAFYHDGSTLTVGGKSKQQVRYDPERCWGCGLCANTCPSGAIIMEALA